MGDEFAPPLNKLGDSGLGVAPAPTGGMGLALTPDGKLPPNIYPVGLGGPPGTELTYDEFTANVTVSATTEAAANTVVTAKPLPFDGATPVIVEFFSIAVVVSATGGDRIEFYLYEDGSSIGRIGAVFTPAGAGSLIVPARLSRRLTPSNASHTYSIRARRVTANGTVVGGAGGSGADLPGYIRITKA